MRFLTPPRTPFSYTCQNGAHCRRQSRACATFGYTREEFRQLDVGKLGTGEHPIPSKTPGTDRTCGPGEQLRVNGRQSKNGTLRWHEVFVKRVLSADRIA